MWIRLIRKLAASLDGVDVSRHAVGDVFDVKRQSAKALIAEGWAEAAEPPSGRAGGNRLPALRTAERLRELRQQMEAKTLGEQERRRREDDIREELRDSRARTVPGAPTGSKSA
jgi:hypothetical protein